MPLYSYRCDHCNHKWDDFRTINERNVPLNQPCPKCNKMKVRKAFGTSTYLDETVLNADKNMERSGVLKELERMKRHHPYMRWHG